MLLYYELLSILMVGVFNYYSQRLTILLFQIFFFVIVLIFQFNLYFFLDYNVYYFLLVIFFSSLLQYLLFFTKIKIECTPQHRLLQLGMK